MFKFISFCIVDLEFIFAHIFLDQAFLYNINNLHKGIVIVV